MTFIFKFVIHSRKPHNKILLIIKIFRESSSSAKTSRNIARTRAVLIARRGYRADTTKHTEFKRNLFKRCGGGGGIMSLKLYKQTNASYDDPVCLRDALSKLFFYIRKAFLQRAQLRRERPCFFL